jgi:hypothetical protein
MKFKYILCCAVFVLCFCFPFNAEPAVLLDIYGIYANIGDEGNVTGAGLTVNSNYFFNRYKDDLGPYFSFYAARRVDDMNRPQEEVTLFMPAIIGLRYTFPSSQKQVRYEFSAGGGGAYIIKQGPKHIGTYIDASKSDTDKGFGPYAEILAGVSYQFIQNFAFFINGGYHYARFNSDNIGDNASGIQVSFGIRWTVSGRGIDLNSY